MLIAQITDLHIRPSGKKAYGLVDTEAMLRAAVASILVQPMRPDAVIASGDLTDCGLVEEYEAFARLPAAAADADLPDPRQPRPRARTCGWFSAATATCQ